MKRIELKVARIGNSRGVRLPAATLDRYHIGDQVTMEERVEGILLRPPGHVDTKLSWDDTAREMAAAGEDWSDWDATTADGLDEIPWAERRRPRRVAEPNADYTSSCPPERRPSKKRR